MPRHTVWPVGRSSHFPLPVRGRLPRAAHRASSCRHPLSIPNDPHPTAVSHGFALAGHCWLPFPAFRRHASPLDNRFDLVYTRTYICQGHNADHARENLLRLMAAGGLSLAAWPNRPAWTCGPSGDSRGGQKAARPNAPSPGRRTGRGGRRVLRRSRAMLYRRFDRQTNPWWPKSWRTTRTFPRLDRGRFRRASQSGRRGRGIDGRRRAWRPSAR